MSIQTETVDNFLTFYGLERKKPNLKYLTEIYTAFFNIPYENITKIIKGHTKSDPLEKLRLPDELIRNHLRLRMGGTCFSLAYALHEMLQQLGFETYLVTADIQGKMDNHVALVVPFEDSKFLVDPGFTIPNLIEIAEDRITYGHNPIGRVQLEYAGVGRLFRLANRNRKVERFSFILKDIPVSLDYFMELWPKSFNNGALETINICKVIDNRLVRCRNRILTEYTPTGKFQKSIAHNFVQTIEQVYGFPNYLTQQACTLLAEKQSFQKVAVQ